jgi:hypothetical protein
MTFLRAIICSACILAGGADLGAQSPVPTEPSEILLFSSPNYPAGANEAKFNPLLEGFCKPTIAAFKEQLGKLGVEVFVYLNRDPKIPASTALAAQAAKLDFKGVISISLHSEKTDAESSLGCKLDYYPLVYNRKPDGKRAIKLGSGTSRFIIAMSTNKQKEDKRPVEETVAEFIQAMKKAGELGASAEPKAPSPASP